MKTTETILDRIMVDVRREVHEARQKHSLDDLHRMAADAPPVRSFQHALRTGFGLIAEIKECSPSQGPMRRENVDRAPAAYEQSPAVHGLSVLTNATHFGMSMERLRDVRAQTTKPVLRKDFIFDPYQVHEARAFGADAILLMANLLEADELQRLYDLARSLGMDALFECHDRDQIAAVPSQAEIYGINSRTFASSGAAYEAARTQRAAGAKQDLTTDLSRFELGRHLPVAAIKVAESGVHPQHLAAVQGLGLFHAILVGTSLLTAPHGIEMELEAFEKKISKNT